MGSTYFINAGLDVIILPSNDGEYTNFHELSAAHEFLNDGDIINVVDNGLIDDSESSLNLNILSGGVTIKSWGTNGEDYLINKPTIKLSNEYDEIVGKLTIKSSEFGNSIENIKIENLKIYCDEPDSSACYLIDFSNYSFGSDPYAFMVDGCEFWTNLSVDNYRAAGINYTCGDVPFTGVIVRNCIFHHLNKCVYQASMPTKNIYYINNTIYDVKNAFIMIYYDAYSNNINAVYNNIFNTGDVAVYIDYNGAVSAVSADIDKKIFSNNCFYNYDKDFDGTFSAVYLLAENLSADPLFVDVDNNNFRLMYNSPCIDSGILSGSDPLVFTYAPSADFLGNERPYNDNIDIGVYEFGYPNNYYVDLSYSISGDGTTVNPWNYEQLAYHFSACINSNDVYNMRGFKVFSGTFQPLGEVFLHNTSLSNTLNNPYNIKLQAWDLSAYGLWGFEEQDISDISCFFVGLNTTEIYEDNPNLELDFLNLEVRDFLILVNYTGLCNFYLYSGKLRKNNSIKFYNFIIQNAKGPILINSNFYRNEFYFEGGTFISQYWQYHDNLLLSYRNLNIKDCAFYSTETGTPLTYEYGRNFFESIETNLSFENLSARFEPYYLYNDFTYEIDDWLNKNDISASLVDLSDNTKIFTKNATTSLFTLKWFDGDFEFVFGLKIGDDLPTSGSFDIDFLMPMVLDSRIEIKWSDGSIYVNIPSNSNSTTYSSSDLSWEILKEILIKVKRVGEELSFYYIVPLLPEDKWFFTDYNSDFTFRNVIINNTADENIGLSFVDLVSFYNIVDVLPYKVTPIDVITDSSEIEKIPILNETRLYNSFNYLYSNFDFEVSGSSGYENIPYGIDGSERFGIGGFSFREAIGHIGSFYFGPISNNISIDPLEIEAILLEPDIITIGNVSAFVNPLSINTYVNLLEPKIFSISDIDVDFIGIPRWGTSPLIVDFTAIVRFLSVLKGIYKVKEYKWCFDYDYQNKVCKIPWVVTTQNPTTHIYKGYAGQKFSVKCCVTLEFIS